ncbi:hypothetical protein EON80_14120, partial [bacterium]
MVRTLVRAAILGSLIACSCGTQFIPKKALAAEPAPARKYVASSDFTALDGDGVLWGFPLGQPDTIAVWSQGEWKRTDFSPANPCRVIGMWTRADGVVTALWSSYFWQSKDGENEEPTGEYFLTAHRGKESKILYQFHFSVPNSGWVGFNGVKGFRTPTSPLLLTIEGRDLYQVSDAGEVKKLFSIPALDPQHKVKARIAQNWWVMLSNAFTAVNSSDGSIWLHQIGDWNTAERPRFAGLLRVKDGQVTEYAAAQGLPVSASTPVEAIAEAGGPSVFVALQSKGIFEISTATNRARPVATPDKSFQRILQLWGNEGDLYVVVGSENEKDADRTKNYNTLWRRRGGQWKKLIVEMDKDPIATRDFVKTSEGVWVSGQGRGLWFIGADDKPQLVSWERGLRVKPIIISFSPAEGTSFKVSNRSVTEEIPGFAAFKDAQPAPNLTTQRFFLYPVQDDNSHIWAIRNLADYALQQWDGIQWVKHSLPRNYQINSNCELALDKTGRIWILPDAQNGPTIIFDPATRKWQSYPTIRAAILANRNNAWPPAGQYRNQNG